MIFSFLIPMGVGVYRIIQYGVTFPVFMAIIQLSNSLRSPTLQISQLINGYATAKPMKNKYFYAKKNSAKKLKNNEVEDFKEITITNMMVKFNQEEVLKNISLKINKQDKILVVGPSGIGKSTLLRVIQQTIKLTDGEYLFNGNKNEQSLAKLFSLIRQQPLIFNDTILYNITLGEFYLETEVKKAVNLAQLNDVINEKGLDYIVGENGSNLSTGQLQRIEIARALIRERPIILADEITSSLEVNKAQAVRETLLKSSYTVIEVAHNVKEINKDLYAQIWDLEIL